MKANNYNYKSDTVSNPIVHPLDALAAKHQETNPPLRRVPITIAILHGGIPHARLIRRHVLIQPHAAGVDLLRRQLANTMLNLDDPLARGIQGRRVPQRLPHARQPPEQRQRPEPQPQEATLGHGKVQQRTEAHDEHELAAARRGARQSLRPRRHVHDAREPVPVVVVDGLVDGQARTRPDPTDQPPHLQHEERRRPGVVLRHLVPPAS